MTTADRRHRRALILAVALAITAGCRDGGTSTSPTVAEALTPQEWVDGIRLCLERAGVRLTDEPDGSFSYEPGPGMSRAEMGEIEAGCREDLGPAPKPPTDAATARKYYDAYLETADCLEDLGYAVTEPPSLEVFTDQFAEGTGGFWDPFDGVYEQFPSAKAEDEAVQECTRPIEE